MWVLLYGKLWRARARMQRAEEGIACERTSCPASKLVLLQ